MDERKREANNGKVVYCYLPSGRGGAGNGSFSDIIINKNNKKIVREDSNYEKYKSNK